MNAVELLRGLGGKHHTIDGGIDAERRKDFIEQFRRIFSSSSAKQSRGIVYVWWTRGEIPRLRGKSNVIYIGKTKASLYERHHRYATVEGDGLNLQKYQYIIQKFGPIRVSFVVHENPREAEKELLMRYLEEHLEYPPINSSG